MRHGFSLKRLIITIVYLALVILFLNLFINAGQDIYKRGFSIIGVLLFSFAFARSLIKFFNDEVRAFISYWIIKVIAIVFYPLVFVVKKIYNFFGFGKKNFDEERTFVFNEVKLERRKNKKLKNDKKWGDQVDNSARVRFLYIEYMIKRIKLGYDLKRTMTPNEVSKEIAFEEDEKLLFSTYDNARYSKKKIISDDTVLELVKLSKKKYD